MQSGGLFLHCGLWGPSEKEEHEWQKVVIAIDEANRRLNRPKLCNNHRVLHSQLYIICNYVNMWYSLIAT